MPAITAVDTHAHVFSRDAAFAGKRRYTPATDATLADYLAMLDRTGSSHGVLIQPSFLGVDNATMLAAIAAAPERLRGVAVVEPTLPFGELAALDARGIVGVRLNLIGESDPPLGTAPWQRHLRDVARLGWHVEIQAEASRLSGVLPPLLAAGVSVVVDHFGRLDPRLGVGDPGFESLCSLGSQGPVFVKLSGPYRLGAGDLGERNAADAAARLLAAFGPHRLLWGSDWPHTQFEASTDTSAMRARLDAWVPDAAARDIVLARTPARLFKFDRAAAG